jgi:hypothetical protein
MGVVEERIRRDRCTDQPIVCDCRIVCAESVVLLRSESSRTHVIVREMQDGRQGRHDIKA